MSDLIRVYGMTCSHGGTCRKCGLPRAGGGARHDKCDRWPGNSSMNRGFRYIANSQETTIGELKRTVAALSAGESDDTPIRFDLRIRSEETTQKP